MINLHERMLPTSAGVEPATSWSPVGRASNWATEAGYEILGHLLYLGMITAKWACMVTAFPTCTRLHAHQAKTQISVWIRAVWPVFTGNSVGSQGSSGVERRLWSTWTDARADLRVRCAHKLSCRKVCAPNSVRTDTGPIMNYLNVFSRGFHLIRVGSSAKACSRLLPRSTYAQSHIRYSLAA